MFQLEIRPSFAVDAVGDVIGLLGVCGLFLSVSAIKKLPSGLLRQTVLLEFALRLGGGGGPVKEGEAVCSGVIGFCLGDETIAANDGIFPSLFVSLNSSNSDLFLETRVLVGVRALFVSKE